MQPSTCFLICWAEGLVSTLTPRGQHVAEPIFAARPGGADESDGWVLVMVYDEVSQTSRVAVLDAAAPDAGPLGCACFDHHVPVTLHGTWVPG
jgi:carotenoid cleavage dioxygenase